MTNPHSHDFSETPPRLEATEARSCLATTRRSHPAIVGQRRDLWFLPNLADDARI